MLFRYIFKRFVSSLLTVFFIASATFWCMHAVPGDPLSGNKAMLPEIRANLEAKYGLDKPVFTQYVIFLKNLAMGDFGISFAQKNRSVNDIIKEHFPISAMLGVLAIFFATLGGILYGTISAHFRNKWPDMLIMVVVIAGVSVPSFVFAALAQLGIIKLNNFFGVEILPVAGWGTFSHMIVPAFMLGIGSMAYMTRLMRSTMLETSNQDYVRTAKSKGVPGFRIFHAHKLRNAILPLVTVLGPAIAAITTGGFVTEQIFSIPGLGRFFVQAINQLDYTVIMGTTVFYGTFLVFMILVVDILYGVIDPRIRVEK